MTGSPVVIDASIALRWLLPDPLSQECWRLFERITEAGGKITAPALLVYEVVSGLTKAVYIKNISSDEARKSMRQFFILEPELAEANEVLSQSALDWTFRLGRAAAYDSYYLALAESLGCDFWTADLRLYRAAREIDLDWVYAVQEA